MQNIWNQLTTPHPAVQSDEHQQRARLLAALLIIFLPLFAIPEGIRAIQTQTIVVYYWIVVALLIIAYALSRSQHFQVGIVITLVVLTLLPTAGILSRGFAPDRFLPALIWMVPTVLIGSLLLTIRGTAVMGAINIILGLALIRLLPDVTIGHLIYPLGFSLTVFLLLLVATAVRQQYINRIKAQSRELSHSEEQFRSLVENSHTGIVQIDTQFRFNYANSEAGIIFGASQDALIGRDFRTVLAERSVQLVSDFYRRRQAGEDVPSRYLFYVVRPDGEERLVEIRSSIYINAAGNVQTIAQLLDITERKQMEDALRSSEELYQSLVNNLPQNIFRKGVDGRFTFANDNFCQAHSKPLAEIIGKTDFDLHPSEMTHKYRADDEHVIATGETFETVEAFELLNGNNSYVQTVKTPTYDSEGHVTGIQGIFWDVTEVRQAQEALRQSEAKNRALSESTFEALFFSDKGICIECNQSAMKMFGYTYDELIGIFGTDVIAEESREIVRNYMLAGYEKPYEATAQRKDGSTFPAEFHGKMYAYEGRMVRVTAVRDITERKHAQKALQKAHDELELRVQKRTEELATANIRLKDLDVHKDRFIEDMSHELRTPLSNLNLYLDLMEMGNPKKQAKYMKTLRQATQRLIHISEGILTITRLNLYKDAIRRNPLNLNEIIAHIVQQHQHTADKIGLQLTFTPHTSLPPILAEQSQIVEVITNLLENSLNFTRDGQIFMRTFFDEGRQQNCFEVSDTGIGIDNEDIPFVFDRFFRGQDTAQSNIPGSGMGLAIVKEIVALHGGGVAVESQKGQGSVFRVWLPTAAVHNPPQVHHLGQVKN